MTPGAKLDVANGLMLLGLAPVALGMPWAWEMIAYAWTHGGRLGDNMYVMGGIMMLGYVPTLAVSLIGRSMSIDVARRHPQALTSWSRALRTSSAAGMALPVVLCAVELLFAH